MNTPHVNGSTHAHVTDGVLLAMHDGEQGDDVDAGRAHVEHCAQCRARMSEIAGYAGRVHEALSFVPVPAFDADVIRRRIEASAPRRLAPIWRRPAFQAAAAVVILAVAAAASPLRHWVAARIARPTPSVTRPADSPKVAPKGLSGATVSFAATGPEFIIRLDSMPAAGVLIIERAIAAEISARVTSGAGTGGDDMLVLPGELRLRNASSSRASYTVSLPPTVARLRVVVAGRSVFDGPPTGSVALAR